MKRFFLHAFPTDAYVCLLLQINCLLCEAKKKIQGCDFLFRSSLDGMSGTVSMKGKRGSDRNVSCLPVEYSKTDPETWLLWWKSIFHVRWRSCAASTPRTSGLISRSSFMRKITLRFNSLIKTTGLFTGSWTYCWLYLRSIYEFSFLNVLPPFRSQFWEF